MEENLITEKIIGAVIKIHKTLGPGLLESAYQECIKQTELIRRKRKTIATYL